MERLTGKAALVTGAGQGIGRGIALALASEGASVALVGRTLAKLDEAAAEITARGGRALCLPGDVTDAAQVHEMVEQTVAAFGGLDVVVNNAQEYSFGPVADLDVDGLQAGWRSGVLGTLHFMQAARPHLAGGGVVVNVTSSAASDANPAGVGGYAAVKAAIGALSRAAAVEWGREGVRVLTLVPFARTPAVAAALDANPGLEEQLLSQVPLGRFGDPEHEIGRVVAFAASSEASFMTGSSLVVDGGSAYLR